MRQIKFQHVTERELCAAVCNGHIKSVHVIPDNSRWRPRFKTSDGDIELRLVAKRGHERTFATLDSIATFLRDVGLRGDIRVTLP